MTVRMVDHLIFEYGPRDVPGLRKGNLVPDHPCKNFKVTDDL